MNNARTTRAATQACLLAICVGAAAFNADAATLRWQNAAGGHFTTLANWDLGVAPSSGTGDVAVFGLDAAYAVLGSIDAATLSVEAGDVTFDTGYAAFWNIGAGADQTASATVTGFMQGDFGMRVGTGAGATGAFTLTGSSADFTLFGLSNDDIVVGRAGDLESGRLEVSAGARLDTYGVQTHGRAIVTGAGSSLSAYFSEVTGRMDITNGASAGAAEWTVAGQVHVEDAALLSDGVFQAEAGSHVTLTRGAIESAYPVQFTNATLAIDGASSLTADELRFHDSVLSLTIGAEAFSAPEPLISATQFADFQSSTLEIDLLGDFTPLAGQTLHLLRIHDTLSGSFETPFASILTTGLPGHLSADLQFVTNGVSGGYDAFVAFVPTPGTGALLAVAAPLLLTRRRNR